MAVAFRAHSHIPTLFVTFPRPWQVHAKELGHVRWEGQTLSASCCLVLKIYFTWHFCFSTFKWEESWKERRRWLAKRPHCVCTHRWFALIADPPCNVFKAGSFTNLGGIYVGVFALHFWWFFFFFFAWWKALHPINKSYIDNYLMRASRFTQNSSFLSRAYCKAHFSVRTRGITRIARGFLHPMNKQN